MADVTFKGEKPLRPMQWPEWLHHAPIGTMTPQSTMPVVVGTGTVKLDTEIMMGTGSQWISTWLCPVYCDGTLYWQVNHRDSWRVRAEEGVNDNG